MKNEIGPGTGILIAILTGVSFGAVMAFLTYLSM